MRPVTRLIVVTVVSTLAACGVALVPVGASAEGKPWVKRAQRDLNRLHCDGGPADGRVDDRTRAALLRFQSANRLAPSGRFTKPTRKRLDPSSAGDCAHRPVPKHSGKGRRIVLSQRQNWVWLVRANGRVATQGGAVDNPRELGKGLQRTGPRCGRAGRIKDNSDYSGRLRLHNFVRFAPCGIGFHQVPTYRGNGRQIHGDWLLGTNRRTSHGCIRVSRRTSQRIWDFTRHTTRVFVVRG